MTSELVFSGGAYRSALQLKVSPQARSMRIRVDSRTGNVVLTVPRRTSHKRALAWAESKRNWIEAVLADMPQGIALVSGASIPFRGIERQIEWQASGSRIVRAEETRILVGGPEDAVEARLLRWLRQEALRLLSDETHAVAAKAGVKVERVGVGDPTSRWGSCSSSGAIRYSWRLILAPDFVWRATVAHEVAHRVHMNHGRDFHDLVEHLFGNDPRPANAWLRSHGASLHRIGRRAGA